MESLNQTGIRTMVLLGGLLVLAAVAVGSFRSAALLQGTMGMAGVLVQVLKTRPARSGTRTGPPRTAQPELAERPRRAAALVRVGRRAVVVGG
jgi:hypothetical protein